MAYTFKNKPFQWTKIGSDPTTQEISLGLQGGMALPADFVNQQWTKTYQSIKEIQDKIEDGTIGGSGDNLSATKTLKVGTNCTVGTENSAAIGNTVTSVNGVVAVGRFNKTPTASTGTSTDGDVFVIGNGTVGSVKSNALRITSTGDVMGTKAYTASGADYAEVFEWIDGNPNNEDRRGLFVTLDGEKIKPANKGDFIAGIISATPSVIGDAHTDDWHGKYETDVFGERIIENGSYKLSNSFDIDKDDTYISRLKRSEYGVVGLVGKLIVCDDRSCKVNGFCEAGENGVATAAESGYRVMSRIDETHIKILLK